MAGEKKLALSYDFDRGYATPLDVDDILWIPSSYLASNNVVISIDDLVGIGCCNCFVQLVDTPNSYTNFCNCIVQVNSDGTALTFGSVSALASCFIQLGQLRDVDLTGICDKQVLCYDASNLKWIPAELDLARNSILELYDTPSTFDNHIHDVVRVNDTGTGLEFVSGATALGEELLLTDLKDVCVCNPVDNQILQFDASICCWVANNLPEDKDEKVATDSNDSNPDYLGNKVDQNYFVIDLNNHILTIRSGVLAPFCHCHVWSDINKSNSSLNDIADVCFTCIQDGQILVWSDSINTFVNCDRITTDEHVKIDCLDPIAGYLCDKIDNVTIKVNSNYQLCVTKDYFALFNHNHDDRYYLQCQIDTFLANKSDCGHNHDDRYYTQTCLDNGVLDSRYYTETEINSLLATKSDCGHNHDDRYYTQTCLDNGVLDSRYYTETEINSLLATKSDCGHNHDDRYYLQCQIDTFLANKSDCGHTHDLRYYTQTCLANGVLDSRYYTQTQIDCYLANKSDCGHTHVWIDIDKTGSSINDLGDVDINSPSIHSVLCYDGSSWIASCLQYSTTDELVKVSNVDPTAGYLCDKIDTTTLTVKSNFVIGVIDNLYASYNHNHDDRYYLQCQIDTFLANKSDCGHNHDDRYYTQAQIDCYLANKSDCGHNHDDRYYTQSQIDCYLANKSDCGHNHDDRYYLQCQINAFLADKSDCGHTHVWTDIDKTGSKLYDIGDVSANPGINTCCGCVLTWDGTSYILCNVDDLFGQCGRIALYNGDTLDYMINKINSSIFCVDCINSQLDIIPNTFALYNHNHDDRYYTQSQIDCYLANKSDCGHNHDDRYYTQNQINDILSCYSLCTHTHDLRYYTQTCLDNGILDNRYYTQAQIDCFLANKSDCGHTHTWSEISKTGSSINDLGDVLLNNIVTGNILCYDGANWVNTTIVGTDEHVKTLGSDTAGYLCDKIDTSTLTIIGDKISVIDNLYAPYNHNHDDRYYTQAQIDCYLANKSDCGHNHDDRYYTQSQLENGELDNRYYTQAYIDNLLTCYALCDHNHDDRYYTQTCLDNGVLDSRYYTKSETDCLLTQKANLVHTHVWTDIDKTGSSINDLDDIIITNPQQDQLLSFDGSVWKNISLNSLATPYTQTFSTTAGSGTIDSGPNKVLTVTFINHGFLKGQRIKISGSSLFIINRDYIIDEVIDQNTFLVHTQFNTNVSNESVTITPYPVWEDSNPQILNEAINRIAVALAGHIGYTF